MTNIANNPNVYTFYHDIDKKYQDIMIEYWKLTWKQAGFNPIVLNITDAQKHPFYEEYKSNILEISNFLKVNFNMSFNAYGLISYLRWIAYASVDNTDPFFVSDYDVLNLNFKFKSCNFLKDKLTFLDRLNMSVCYGDKNNFLNLCKDMSNMSLINPNIEKIKDNNFFYDRSFIKIFRKNLKYIRFKDTVVNFKEKLWGAKKMFDMHLYNTELLHISHRSALLSYKEQVNILEQKSGLQDMQEIKLSLIKKIYDLYNRT